MNYEKLYNLLICKYKKLNLQKSKILYTENHHINPRCMGGSDENNNKVRLSAKAHFVAHHLLYKIYDSPKIKYAFWAMCTLRRNGFQNRKFIVTPIIYEQMKIEINKLNKNKKISDEHKQKLCEAHTGRKHSEETKRKISEGNKGKSLSKEHIEALRKFNTGRKHSTETKRKLSESHIGNKHTEESKKKISENLKGHTTSIETRLKIGKSNKGKRRTSDQKIKLSQLMKGKNNPNYGKIYTLEEKIKKSEDQIKYLNSLPLLICKFCNYETKIRFRLDNHIKKFHTQE